MGGAVNTQTGQPAQPSISLAKGAGPSQTLSPPPQTFMQGGGWGYGGGWQPPPPPQTWGAPSSGFNKGFSSSFASPWAYSRFQSGGAVNGRNEKIERALALARHLKQKGE